jgi:hypothetical protein
MKSGQVNQGKVTCCEWLLAMGWAALLASRGCSDVQDFRRYMPKMRRSSLFGLVQVFSDLHMQWNPPMAVGVLKDLCTWGTA